MKKNRLLRCLFFAPLFLCMPPKPVCAAPLSAQENVRSAFKNAGLQLLREKTAPPSFVLSSLSGKDVKFADFKGKVVFLNFWATWCPPCRAEMPSMEILHREFKDLGLVILAVDIMEQKKQVEDFMKKNNLSFTALLDTKGKTSSDYGVKGIPSTFIIDKDGFLLAQSVGGRDWSSDKVLAAFAALLKDGS